ncbi:MFS transporter [Aquimarina sp. SS2-1]|uniref:MFS transporter n=1 Tax=Aquimarina besae TaxID=3342247 RepID=UPI00366CD1A6
MKYVEKLYKIINNEKEERICKGIDKKACNHVPRNYFILLLSSVFIKLGDTLSNPKTVLTWVMSYVHAPVYLISFIVPIRESGSMIPQILLSNYIKTKKIRKWVWILGAFFQFISIALIGMVSLYFEGTEAGWFIILLLIVFSLSRSLSSISSKDVLGKTIPKTRRGKLKGYTSSLSGMLVLIAGLFLIYPSNQEQGITFYSSILFFASSLWLVAAIIYANIKEFPAQTTESKNDIQALVTKLKILKTDTIFRNFIISRSLLLCSALSAPFYVLLAQKYLGNESYLLGLLIIANGVAAIISAPIWGQMADVSSNKVMMIGAIITSILGLIMFFFISYVPFLRNQYWLYPMAFFILGIAHSGVRLGRKTYIIDMAKDNKRTDYVAISNTLIGIILLITGGISALASIISIEGVILVLSLLGLFGANKAARLPNVQKR